MAGDVLHERDGALDHERDRVGVGADAVACDAAGGVGRAPTGLGTEAMREPHQIVGGGCTNIPRFPGNILRGVRPRPSKKDRGDRAAAATGKEHLAGRIWRGLRRLLHERWSAEAWPQIKAEFKKALALRSQIRRAGWFN